MPWQITVDKCHDELELRIDNSGGQLISWPDRGDGGRVTWTWRDPVSELRDISQFVGDGDQIKLWAKIKETGATGDHQCDMDTRYNGESKQRWEFDEEEDHEIHR
jgi:hypothetical protein